MPRVNPFEAAERGIERFSTVYGVVPLLANGNIMREHGQSTVGFPEWPDKDTPWVTRKGIVARESRVEREVIETIKVSWQATALGQSAVSRGTIRWPHTFQIFTPEEMTETIRDLEVLEGSGTDFVTGSLDVDPEATTGQIDELIEHPIGNILLTRVLNDANQQRWQQCWEQQVGSSPS
jgi:hypothetical protein